jgi:hypothetical protein
LSQDLRDIEKIASGENNLSDKKVDVVIRKSLKPFGEYEVKDSERDLYIQTQKKKTLRFNPKGKVLADSVKSELPRGFRDIKDDTETYG